MNLDHGKYLEQEGIADFFLIFFYTLSFQVFKQSHEAVAVGYCVTVQTCFSLPLF